MIWKNREKMLSKGERQMRIKNREKRMRKWKKNKKEVFDKDRNLRENY